MLKYGVRAAGLAAAVAVTAFAPPALASGDSGSTSGDQSGTTQTSSQQRWHDHGRHCGWYRGKGHGAKRNQARKWSQRQGQGCTKDSGQQQVSGSSTQTQQQTQGTQTQSTQDQQSGDSSATCSQTQSGSDTQTSGSSTESSGSSTQSGDDDNQSSGTCSCQQGDDDQGDDDSNENEDD